VLKYQNYLNYFGGLLKIRRFLHRGNLDGAERLLDRLQGQGAPDVEIASLLSLLEVELLVRRGMLDEALEKVGNLAQAANKSQEINDIAVQTRLLNLKTRILIESGHCLKAFSLVTRAAQIAYRGRILPSLWESITLLATILSELREFTAAIDLLQSIMPQVLECQDCDLAARSYSVLADASMGLAGLEADKSPRQKELTGKAMENVDHAYVQHRYIEDLAGQLEMLQKKATIMHWRGDWVLANDIATQYLDLKREYEAEND